MIKRCILIFPEFNNTEIIDGRRNKYDPLSDKVRPHITVVFPFESDLSLSVLKDHIKESLQGMGKFQIVLSGITAISTDNNYLYLDIFRGKEIVHELHDKLYRGVLSPYLSITHTYIPHITIGKIENQLLFEETIKLLENNKDIFETVINKVSIEIIDDNENGKIEWECVLQ